MTTTNAEGLDKILSKVQGLIAKAESTTFPEEADAFRRKADALMAKFRIEESMLAAAGPVGGFVPEWRDLRVCLLNSPFKVYYRQIATWVLTHVGGEGVFRFQQITNDETGATESWIVLQACGYNSDLRYADMLLTSCVLAFGERMEPQVRPDLSDQINAYRLRKSGMEGWKIAYALWGANDPGIYPSAKSVGRLAGKARRLYSAEAEARGEDPKELMGQGNSVKTYRESYGQGFADEVYYRLRRMRADTGGQSGALVLAGRKDAIKEAFYEKFPQYRPSTEAVKYEECAKCKRAKSGQCRDHKLRMPKAQPVNYQARQAGASAAATVDLGNTKRLT